MPFNVENTIVIIIFAYVIPQGLCCPPRAIGYLTADYDLLVGGDLVLNCSLNKNIINTKDTIVSINSSLLVLKLGSKELTEYTRVVNDLTVQLRIPNASLEYHGSYLCYLRLPPPSTAKKLVCASHVNIGYKPLEVQDFACYSHQLKVLQCTWTPPKNNVMTKYEVSDNIFDKKKCYPYNDHTEFLRPCKKTVGNNTNSCEWSLESDIVYRPLVEKICLFLKGENSLGVSIQQFTIDHYSIVLTGKPVNFTTQIQKNNFTLSWLPPISLTPETFPAGLVYEIQYKSFDSNYWKVRKLVNETEVNITSLIPHTDYNVKLRCRSEMAKESEEMWSKSEEAILRTLPDVPYLAPELTSGLFEVRHLESRRDITLLWKGVPKQFWNAPGFKYIITYSEKNREREKRALKERIIDTEESVVFIDLNIHSAYQFVLSAKNNEGQSQNFTTIIVEKKENMPETPKDIRAIYYGDGRYNISWETPDDDRHHIESYTIVWCRKLQPSFPCKGSLDWKHVPMTTKSLFLNLLDDTYLQFAVSANTKDASSGMEWAQCVVPAYGILNKIKSVILQPLSATSLKVLWNLDCPVYKYVITSYRVSYCKVKPYNHTCSGEVKNITIADNQANSCILEKLEPFTLYRVVAFAITAAGSSEESIPRIERTLAGAPSDPPQHFSIVDKTDTTIELKWEPPSKPNGNINYYEIDISPSDRKFKIKEKNITYKLKNLIPFTNYTLKLTACVNYQCSPPNVISTITEISAPGLMEGPVAVVQNETFVEISWIPPLKPNGPIDFYTLHIDWEYEDEMYTNPINISEESYDLSVTCPSNDKVMIYYFRVQAANMRNGKPLYGNLSNAVQSRLCFKTKGVELGVIVGIVVGSAAVLALVIFILYFIISWMKKKVDKFKDIKVQLPLGLETPQGNPLNSYESFKNGLIRKPSDSNLSPKTFYGRLNSFASDESDPKDRNDSGMAPFANSSQEALIHKAKDQSDGKSNNGGATNGKGHDSISSSLTTRTQLSSDSGAEIDVQAPPSPESDNVPLDLPHASPQPNKSSLPKVSEAHCCDSKDSGLEKEEGGSEKESDVLDPNQYSKFVRYLDNPNHPYNRRQVSEKGAMSQQLPYSKFGVNMPGISGYVPLSTTLALMHRSLANSEPSVVDAETVNKSNPDLEATAIAPAPPYSKYGIGRSLGQSLNMPSNVSDSLGTGYSKCGVGPISWLQQPRSPYIAANVASVLFGNDISNEKKQLNAPANTFDLNGHLKQTLTPLPSSPRSSSPKSKGYVTVENMNKPNVFSSCQKMNGPSCYLPEDDKNPTSKGYVSVQDAKNMLSEDRKLPQLSETKDQTNGIPGYSKFDIQCDKLQNSPNIQTLDPVLTGTKPKTYPSTVHQGYVPYHHPSFDISSVNVPYNNSDHTLNGNLNGDMSPLSTDIDLESENEYELDTGSHSPSKYLLQSKACKPASEPSNGYVKVNADSPIDAIRIVPTVTDSKLCPSLTDTAV